MQSGKNDDGYYDIVAIVAILSSFKTVCVKHVQRSVSTVVIW